MTTTMRPIGEIIGEKARAIADRNAAEAQARIDAGEARGERYIPRYRNALRDDPLAAMRRRIDQGIPRHYQAMTLAAFATYTNGLTEAYRAATAFTEQPAGLLFLFGNPGSGKTHLAVGTAMRLASRGRSVRFWRMMDLAGALREAAGAEDGALEALVALLSRIGVLVLDEFPPVHVTPFVYEQVYRILDARYGTLAPTIITSNLDLEAIDMPRLTSRLADTRFATLVPVYAEDFRRLDMKPRPHATAEPSPTGMCAACGGTGLVRRDLPPGHMDFGKCWPCPACRGDGPALKNGGNG